METLEILKQLKVEGKSVRLPNIQLSRNEYVQLEKTLINAGAKKVRGKDFKFEFDTEASTIIEELCNGKSINIKKEFQFFATPHKLAEKMIYMADLNLYDRLLEPSAGQGAIVDLFPKSMESVFLYEIMPLNRKVLEQKGYQLAGHDFLKSPNSEFYTKIIANPPFSKNQDIDHVRKMYDVLLKNGRIITIMSNHWRECDNKKETEFREFLKSVSHTIEELPEGTFKESGTNISACLLTIKK